MKIKIKELRGNLGNSDYSSDSDSGDLGNSDYSSDSDSGDLGNSDYSSDSDSDDEKSAAQNRKTAKDTIKKINEKLLKEEFVKVEEYPKLFVVHFRGIHFFESFFNQDQRRTYRDKIKSKKIEEDINSPAVHELSDVPLGEEINNTVKQKTQKQIYSELLSLKSIVPSEAFWVQGNHRDHDNLLYQHYHRYVNNYESFRSESVTKNHECYKQLKSTKNPYVSTTDNAVHAVYYALGGKTTTAQSALRPKYDAELRAKHPKVGYVQVIIHSIEDIVAQQPIFLSSLHASKSIDIKCRTLNERETTFLSFIPASNVIDSIIVRFPSFKGDYKSYYKDKYGIDKRSYNAFRKALSGDVESTSLLGKLAEHYAEYLINVAQNAVIKLGGHLVHILLDGTLSLTPFSNFQISDTRSRNIDLDIYSSLNLFYSSNQLQELLSKAFSLYGSKNEEITTPTGFSDVPRDGFCFYHAIARQLNDGRTAQDLQTMAIDHILKNPGDYKEFLSGLEIPGLSFNHMTPHRAIEAYINYHLEGDDRGNNAWADHLMIQAEANALVMEIEVHMFNVDGTPQTHQRGEHAGEEVRLPPFTPHQGAATRTLIVGNINNLHFVTQKPVTVGTETLLSNAIHPNEFRPEENITSLNNDLSTTIEGSLELIGLAGALSWLSVSEHSSVL
jgi:hypothetical protein